MRMFPPSEEERQVAEEFARQVRATTKDFSPKRVVLMLGIILMILYFLYAYLEKAHR